VDETAEPREPDCRIDDRFAQSLLAPDGKNGLQIALERDENEIGFGGADRRPDDAFAEKQHAEQVPAQAGEVDVAQLHDVGYHEEHAAEAVDRILVEDQHVLLVLLRGDQRLRGAELLHEHVPRQAHEPY